MMSNIRDLNTKNIWRIWGIRGLTMLLAMILLAGMVLMPPVETYAQGQETACPDCGGSGKVACSECGGTGVIMCGCGGDGETPCWLCGGDGICYQCDGKGWFEGFSKCPMCGGTGKCQVCHGTGQQECSVCDGKGQLACYHCGGDGQVSCTRCWGTGVIYTEEEEAQPNEEDTSDTEEDVVNGIYEDSEGEPANISAIKAELRNATKEELEKALEEINQYGEGYWLDQSNVYYNLLSQVRANQSLREKPPEEIEGYEFVGRTITEKSIQWAENVQAYGWADDPNMIHYVDGKMVVDKAILTEETITSDHYKKIDTAASDTLDMSMGGITLSVISGEVEVKKGGESEWTKDTSSVLKPGDEVRTGKNSTAVMETTEGDSITFGSETHATTVDVVDLDWALNIWIGKIKAKIKEKLSKFEVRTPTVVVAVRGTEFTVSVDEYGTTTVMVLDGTVEVRDLTSNAGITLPANQTVTVPKGGLAQEEILKKAELVLPEEVDRWWEEDMAATEAESTTTSSGFGVKDLVAITAIILVLILVFGPLLKRKRGSSPG